MIEITSEHLQDDANHTQCECGNQTVYDYVWSDDNGNQSCPLCMVSWQSQQIAALKELIHKVSPRGKEETANMINAKYASIIGIDVEELDKDYSKI